MKHAPDAVHRARPILLHDNARPHTAKKTKEVINALGWRVLEHPPYSPDLAPSDFYLFRSMQHQLSDKIFKNREEVNSFLHNFFYSKLEDYYTKGIYSLPKKWKEVIEASK